MADVDPIVLQISSDFADVKKDLADLKKDLKKTGEEGEQAAKGFTKMAKGLKGVAAAAGAAAAAAGVLAMKQLEAARATDQLARRVGIARSSLSQLGAVGKRFGVDVETMGDAIKDLNVKITDAANGATAYEEVFQKIGLTSKELVKLNPQEQFLKFADAIKKADENTRRFALDEINDAMFQLVPIMEQGSDAIKALGAETLKTGEALSEFQFKELAEVNKSMMEMSSAVEALGNALAIHLAPGLKLAAQWATKLSGAAQDMLGTSESAMKERLEEINELLGKIDDKYKQESVAISTKARLKHNDAYGRYIGLIQEKVKLEGALKSGEESSITNVKAETKAITERNTAIQGSMDLNKTFSEMLAQGAGPNLMDLGTLGKTGETEGVGPALFPKPEEQKEIQDLLFANMMDFQENQFVYQAEHDARMATQHQSFRDWLFEIDKDAEKKTLDLWTSGWSGKQKVTSKFLGQISNLMNTNSRKQFEIGKAAAIAQVAIDTPKAAMSAYSAMAGIPVVGPALGGIAAAAAVATGVAQIQNIKSQSFGGGGGGVGSAAAASGGASAADAGGQGGEPANVVDATFVLQGEGGFSGDQIRSVAAGLNDFIEDGGQIRSVNAI